MRKEEEKTRRELIKQEYLRKKQQEMFEEQGLVKPKTPKPKQKHRPKSVFREESSSSTFSKGSSTRKTTHDLTCFCYCVIKKGMRHYTPFAEQDIDISYKA